ncbi:MAG: pilus assembly protein [Bradyrhizobium sp.]|uniref:TadE/TadG family type IV pilus assembly protein n=1 Tax=Bradyrhizobium sp. TaxID=376 RepID=UPI00120283D2|nr:TadE/TadG family type IV pilus assembly protein [Bradyrhizobium sp.]THD67233.1 MAG: pilus assembly protein [Bradyrhizobium sp.]
MFGASTIRRVRAAAGRFIGANQGNIAVIFAIALVPVISFVGAAVDYSRANSARSSMQAALDSTALMLSKDLSSGLITTSQINAKAQTYFAALYTNPDAQSVSINAAYTASNGSLGSTIQVNGSGSITTDFMRVAGFPNISFNTSSTAAWGNVKMRVAMALDNTGSMAADGKITALRTAATNLINQLSALAQNSGDVYISIIPFAKVVNVGASNYTQNWIDWTDWANPPTVQPTLSPQPTLPSNWSSIGPGSTCSFTTSNSGFVCTTSPVNASSNTSSIPSSGSYKGYICPGLDANSHTMYNGCWTSALKSPAQTATYSTGGSASCSGANSTCSCSGSGKVCTVSLYDHTWVANATSTWTGCVTDRTQPYDAQNTTPTTTTTATLFPANQYYENGTAYCDPNSSTPLQQIVPLSYNWTSLKATIAAMQPTGGTDQAIGLAWAWESLLQSAPMNAPAEDSTYTYNRAIILLSDGLNTEDRWPANGDGSTQNVDAHGNGLIDNRQALLCQNIKAMIDPKTNGPMYTIYTIQVNTSSPADPTSSVLQNCATDPSKFFMLTSANEIVTTFNSIGTSLSQLRVAR